MGQLPTGPESARTRPGSSETENHCIVLLRFVSEADWSHVPDGFVLQFLLDVASILTVASVVL